MSKRTDAIAKYMFGKGAKVDNGSYDEMILVWDKLLARFQDDLLVEMCDLAAREPGRMSVSQIVESTRAYVKMHYMMLAD